MAEFSDDDLRLVEALLLASPEPVTAAQLQRALGGGASWMIDVSAAVAAVAERYRGRGVEVAEAAGGWRLRTAPDLAPRLAAVLQRERPLPRAALEVLAAVALHQPVTRAEIGDLRGAAVAQPTFDLLVDLGLVAPAGHADGPGRPQLWRTTTAFLDHFGLRSLADLPRADHLAAAAPRRGEGRGRSGPADA